MLTRVELIKTDPKFPQAREKFWLNSSMNGIVDTLVRGRLNVVIFSTYSNDLGHFPTILKQKYGC